MKPEDNSSSKESQLAQHILPASANLLGICFLIFGLVRHQENADSTLLDDCAALAILCFLVSSLLSYLCLRSKQWRRAERIADISFLVGLCIMATGAGLIAMRYIK